MTRSQKLTMWVQELKSILFIATLMHYPYIHCSKNSQICFSRQLFTNYLNPWKANTDLVGPLRGINKVVWDAKLLQMSTTAHPKFCGHCGCFSSLLSTQFDHSCLLAVWTHLHPPHPLIRTWHCKRCSNIFQKPASPTSRYLYHC